ncbi:hypothetical protein CURE108131_01110 [Cupriavidus respiraculi]|uniref:Uncharacterized protein n=1 Tax=Cupriavidus respiraculi TaxID=195930 RepID=A0ABN7XWD8_9BURK|nr:hypothetical protein [Cupriavidus respiraculi]MBY4949725.1 hypothetical protein [Cupriavidus respiraculi]CAG9165453.1 hypothetical protein LMG21510_00094 [Cupriavidus respiraculi]
MRNDDEGDLSVFDSESEFEDQETDAFEFEFESGGDGQQFEDAGEMDETEEMELAAELLEVSDEEELDQFIGKLIKRAGRAVGHVVRSDAGRVLGRMVKSAARKALPMLGAAAGGLVGGAAGSKVGGQLAARAGSLFGLELEGLSREDQEFEVARRVVRYADAAVRKLASAQGAGDPAQAARAAALAAAKRHAPGLRGPVTPSSGAGQCPNCGGSTRGGGCGCKGSQGCSCGGGKGAGGRWITRGRHIVLLGAAGEPR